MKKLLLAPLLFLCVAVFGQSFSVSGTVTEKKHNKPIKGAVVQMLGSDGSNVAIKTDSTGHYLFAAQSATERYVKPNTSYILAADANDKNYSASQTKVNITTVGLTASKNFAADFVLDKFKDCTLGQGFVALFDSGKTKITQSMADTVLNNVLKLLKDNPTIVIQVDGHSSSNEGDSKTKMALSEARAKAYMNYLVAMGINAERVKAKGWSDSIKITISEDDAENMSKQQQQEYIITRSRMAAIEILSYQYKAKK